MYTDHPLGAWCSMQWVLSCFSHFNPTLYNPMDYSQQAPLAMGFPRQEYWSGLPLLQRNFPTQESNPHLLSPALAGGFFAN